MLTSEQITWIQTNVQETGHELTSEIVVTHKGAWSQVAKVFTTKGILYFKVTLPVLIYEVRLTQALYKWGMPVPTVLAADTQQGWLLITDSGQVLRSLLQADGDISRWHTAVAQYAQMQIELLDRVDDLLEMGIFDRRLHKLPILYGDLLTDSEAMMIDQEEGLSAVEYAQLQQSVPEFADLCRQLAAFGIHETLHHDDFHDNNIFVRDGRLSGRCG